jgi:hypothetical protein
LLEYHDSLRAEELEGMGVPPEVIESQGSDGMGSSTGRKIPLIAFRSTLRSVADSVLYDFSCQVLDALLFFRYGRMISYSIEPYLPSAANSIQPDLDMISAKNGMPPGSGNPGDKKPDDPDAFDKADLGT